MIERNGIAVAGSVLVDKINEIKNMKVDRSKYVKVVADAGYDAKESAQLLEDKYLHLKSFVSFLS